MANGYLDSYGMPDTAAYDRAQNDLGYKFNTDQATNAYGRFLSQQRGERSLGDMSREFTRALPQQYSQFNRRGLSAPGVQSGVQQSSMQNYLGDYSRNYGLQQGYNAQDLQQFDQAGLQNQAYYQSQLSSLETSKQNEIARAALGIQALKPYFGGI